MPMDMRQIKAIEKANKEKILTVCNMEVESVNGL